MSSFTHTSFHFVHFSGDKLIHSLKTLRSLVPFKVIFQICPISHLWAWMPVSAWREKLHGSTPTAHRWYVGRVLQLELMVCWNVVGRLGTGLSENEHGGLSQSQASKAQALLPVLDFTLVVWRRIVTFMWFPAVLAPPLGDPSVHCITNLGLMGAGIRDTVILELLY